MNKQIRIIYVPLFNLDVNPLGCKQITNMQLSYFMVSKKKPEKLAQKRWTQNISFHTGALFYFS